MLHVPFVLASGSPRRKKLLAQIGLSFSVQASDVEETFDPTETPADIVQRLALRKAASIAAQHPDALTLGADTIVVLDDDVLGKPDDAQAARRMLQRLSGATHTVYTGLALVHPTSQRQTTTFEATEVTFGAMTRPEIDAYVATGSPLDKAGAYGIQDDRGALFVAGIRGDYYNVVGLPLHRFYTVL